ncbi:Drug/Metabolite Transporter (DMT) Superfamily [Thraustotheca clavata]|uniref:Drug/Metabolite Transporter (DMT) Superfamily n=1 Tax=Thraustotheca clavata TaxID=74557 RepID=A0A1V9ZA38_9STRA|nr:Drug/Metabolite Transporter (DMT) Superfamily [Thraustotheca clavata]
MKREEKKNSTRLTMVFLGLIVIGLGNKIFQKLQTIPMHNYPNFINLLCTFVYIPLSFAYIIPMIKYGNAITWDQQNIPKKKFAVMGALDSVAGILQIFAATYLGGSLLILLGQAAIPVSMVISKLLLKASYSMFQYIGALVVTAGLLIVLGPSMQSSSGSGHDTVIWSAVMIASCIPMCLSSVYKEIALGEAELDVVYLNGWIAVFQFLLSIPLAFPAAAISSPPVAPKDLMNNLYDGMKCYLGENTIVHTEHPDDCEKATLYVTIYMLFNVLYNILIILMLKFGSANILWLAMTIMVPLGNVAFTFSFMPEHQPLHTTDIIGLVVIMLGLFVYRFLGDLLEARRRSRAPSDLKESLMSDF